MRDASTVATPASRDATASAAHIAIGQTLVPTHMSKDRFGATSAFAASLAKPGGLAELAKLGERLTHPKHLQPGPPHAQCSAPWRLPHWML